MAFKHYRMRIIPEMDSELAGDYVLSDEEASIVKKVLSGLKPKGDWAPYVIFECKEDIEAVRKAAEAKAREEERQKLEEALGINRKFPSAFELAYKAALEKREVK